MSGIDRLKLLVDLISFDAMHTPVPVTHHPIPQIAVILRCERRPCRLGRYDSAADSPRVARRGSCAVVVLVRECACADGSLDEGVAQAVGRAVVSHVVSDDVVGLGVQARHLEVYPDQVVGFFHSCSTAVDYGGRIRSQDNGDGVKQRPDAGPAGLVLTTIGVAAVVFASGTLLYTVMALTVAPQVVMFLGLTHATIGIERVAPGGPDDPDRPRGPAGPRFRVFPRLMQLAFVLGAIGLIGLLVIYLA